MTDAAGPGESDLGTVFVSFIFFENDEWTATWQLGADTSTVYGTKAEMLAWARSQPAGTRLIFDLAQQDYVPLHFAQPPSSSDFGR